MARGRFFLAAALSLSTLVALPSVCFAEDSAASDSVGGHVFQGEVNANAVFVRSRASEDAYPTQKLAKGTVVTVVGIKGQWLKIDPPEGSFAYVPKSFINLRGDGTVGRATRDTIAHAGSQLNELAIAALATVHEGDDVQIVGQYNEYFKIKPPKDSFLWINKQFVDPVKTVTPTPPPAPLAQNPTDDSPKPQTEQPTQTAKTSTTQPASETVADNTANPPATQPADTSIADYDKLEQQFADCAGKSVVDQPIPELLAGYQKLADADQLPSSMRSIVDIRIATLKARNDARTKFLEVQANAKKMAEQRQALAAERQEIEDRIRKNDLQVYAALGTLRPSSLQIGQGQLFRLTDPASGRTVCYVRTTEEAKFAPFLGDFVGVRGTITQDPQLNSIIEKPADIQSVDQTKVNQSVAAQIVPPSLLRFAPVSIVPATQPASGNPANPSAIGATDQTSSTNEPQ